MKMHADQFDTSLELARELVDSQFPQWSDRALTEVRSTGTSNAMYRLGADKVVRLPLQPGAERSVGNEHRWLPELAPMLPLDVPVALGRGQPTDDFPSVWSICPWLPGEDGTSAGDIDLAQAAVDLAGFMRALQSCDTAGAPRPKPEWRGRGVPLATRAESVHRSLRKSTHLVDSDALLVVWSEAVGADVWPHDPVWVHGDIAAGNLLFLDGRLSAAIDWSPMGVGDPACDLIVAWEVFDHAARQSLRTELDVDDATWLRSRGWALSTAIDAAYYYEHSNQFMFDQAMHKLNVLLTDPT